MNRSLDSQPRAPVVDLAGMKWGTLTALALVSFGPAAAAPVKIQHDSKALEFSCQWPAEAAAIRALDQRFRNEETKAYRDALANARYDQKLAGQQKRDYNAHYYSMTWTTAGQSPRLLSLQSENGTFTGGAHPNTSYGSLLWDRRLGREVGTASLFGRRGDFAALTRSAYCRRLDAERKKRREGMVLGGEFDQCPAYSDLAIAPVDKNKDGRFDRFAFVASPYVAGPYVEGEYEIFLPISAKLMAALKPEYRSSFEAQRQ